MIKCCSWGSNLPQRHWQPTVIVFLSLYATEVRVWKDSRDRTHDRGCTCTVIFISRPQLLHITTVGFHKAKARMNPPANSHRRTESIWGGWNPQACSDGSECNVQQFIFIYIFIEYIQYNSETQTKRQTSHSTQIQNKDGPTLFFLIKKIIFALFSVKVQLNQNRTSSKAFLMWKEK